MRSMCLCYSQNYNTDIDLMTCGVIAIGDGLCFLRGSPRVERMVRKVFASYIG